MTQPPVLAQISQILTDYQVLTTADPEIVTWCYCPYWNYKELKKVILVIIVPIFLHEFTDWSLSVLSFSASNKYSDDSPLQLMSFLRDTILNFLYSIAVRQIFSFQISHFSHYILKSQCIAILAVHKGAFPKVSFCLAQLCVHNEAVIRESLRIPKLVLESL